MSPTELFAIFTACIGLLVAIISLLVGANAIRRITELKAHLKHMQSNVENITQVQMQLHRFEVQKTAMARTSSNSASLMVSLEGEKSKARFVVRNWGYGAASNIDMRVQPVTGERLPHLSSEYDRKLPIPRLEAGEEFDLDTKLTFDTGSTFDVNLGWQDEDGGMRSASSRVSL